MRTISYLRIYLKVRTSGWIEQADLGSENLVELDLTGRPIKKTEIWITGTITPIAMKKFSARGLVVNERVGDVLLPQTEREELQEEETQEELYRELKD